MDEALLALLEKKEFAYITIRELCAAAGVNHSTFYLHYQNITELLEESIAYMNRQFYECFPPKHEDTAKAHFLSPAYLEPYLTYVKEHRRLFRTALRQSAVLRSEEQFRFLFQEVFSPYMARLGIPERERPLHDTVLSARNFGNCRAVAGAGLPGAGGRYHRDDFAVYAHRGSHIETPAGVFRARRCGHLRSFFWFFCSLGSF